MRTFLKRQHSVESQTVLPFTGEGAYHGSTKPRARSVPEGPPPPMVDEMRPTTAEKLASGEKATIDELDAVFPNRHEVKAVLAQPAQDEIRDDGVTFCWCPMDVALKEAGPLTSRVLDAMAKHLGGKKRHVYIDSKLQYFQAGDVPVDSQHWHVDGSITVRDPWVRRLGHGVLHDMRARLERPASSPTYLAYQSSTHCATLFVTAPVRLRLPELVPSFDLLDERVRDLDPPFQAQPAGSIVSFDGLSLHRATAATAPGWRLWIRCVETDRQVHLTSDIIECYGTVFRTHGKRAQQAPAADQA
jgi:hypothetical protein